MIGLLLKPFTFLIKLVVTSAFKAVFYGAIAAAPLVAIYLVYKCCAERRPATEGTDG